MKKMIIFFIIIVLSIILTGCSPTDVEHKEVVVSNFVVVERSNLFVILYDKETLVMYAVSYYGTGRGEFTMLVNADGTPKLWKEEQQ